MSDLVVIAYHSEQQAEEVRKRLLDLQKEYVISIADAVIATKTPSGEIKLNQLVNLKVSGALSGSFWGLLIGLVFLNPLVGVAIGAASGVLSGALSDYGINDQFMKDVATSIEPGDAALFILVRQMTETKVLAAIEGFGGKVLKTSLDDSKEQALRAALARAVTSDTLADDGPTK
ncbi:MAG: DUF1269 domain-containing protein [Inquilinus sp.]|uniref:DUF1269 domain-containing protein n=1 Tax=Inquilinus sp. TaxID=1932117 RepID=UPI003F3F5850